MNAAELFVRRKREMPEKLALWLPDGTQATFAELEAMGAATQRLVRAAGVAPGDTVLLCEALGPRLYGAVLGLMAMGVGVALVEPWMPVAKVSHVLSVVKPKAFLSHLLGRLWGARVRAVRAIPHWISTSQLVPGSEAMAVEALDGDAPGIVTFTSGTTGKPKGVVRTHRYLVDQHRVLSGSLHADEYPGPDLCIFANFVLANLASGRTSLVVPPRWRAADMLLLTRLPEPLRPVSLTCGPAFLMRLMQQAPVTSLRSIHVGGALTDCAILEHGFAAWPDADWVHLYGSTEVEPVATMDAREAVRRSRAANYFQTLCLGRPVDDIEARLTPDTVWVTGPHVCPSYLANDAENAKHKSVDERGRVWHRMGDRLVEKDGVWWYQGREGQPAADFALEQKVYSLIQSSAAFVHVDDHGERSVYCQHARRRGPVIKNAFPEVRAVHPTRIQRDRRHRARIDRQASLRRSRWSLD